MAIRDDAEGRKALARELYDRFHAMKTYGKEPESLKSIVSLFLRDLAVYPLDKILKAISLHARRSQEFPTVADIAGLIRRNGRAPMTKEVYVAISKKEPALRTPEDWSYMRDYEAEQMEAEFGSDQEDDKRLDEMRADNARLRQQLREANAEIQRLGALAVERLGAAQRMSAAATQPAISQKEKVARTIAAMRLGGAEESDIEAFAEPHGGAQAFETPVA